MDRSREYRFGGESMDTYSCRGLCGDAQESAHEKLQSTIVVRAQSIHKCETLTCFAFEQDLKALGVFRLMLYLVRKIQSSEMGGDI